MNYADRARINDLCKQIAAEKDPQKLEKLTRELNDLLEPILKSAQPKSLFALGTNGRK